MKKDLAFERMPKTRTLVKVVNFGLPKVYSTGLSLNQSPSQTSQVYAKIMNTLLSINLSDVVQNVYN